MLSRFFNKNFNSNYDGRIISVAKKFTTIFSALTIIGIPLLIASTIIKIRSNRDKFFFFASALNSFLIDTAILGVITFFILRAVQKNGGYASFSINQLICAAALIAGAISVLFLCVANLIFYLVNVHVVPTKNDADLSISYVKNDDCIDEDIGSDSISDSVYSDLDSDIQNSDQFYKDAVLHDYEIHRVLSERAAVSNTFLNPISLPIMIIAKCIVEREQLEVYF